MKTIGLIGGMSWESTASYYRVINETIKGELGGLHSAKLILYSVDFHEIEHCQANDAWDKSAGILGNAAAALEKAGVDFIILCTNTMHKVYDKIAGFVSVPILHIADVTAAELKLKGVKTVILLGTKYTMEQTFYKSRLLLNGVNIIIPNEPDRILINDVIYNELCLGIASEKSKIKFLEIINQMNSEAVGVDGIILGCTEIGLLINQNDTDIRLFDTAKIHAEKAAMYSIGI